MKLFKFLAATTFQIIGGFCLGISIPTSHGIISTKNPMIDFLVLFPIGVLLLGTSYYYKFIHKK